MTAQTAATPPPRGAHLIQRLAWPAAALSILLVLIGGWIDSMNTGVDDDSGVLGVLWVSGWLGFPIVGALIASRRPTNRVGLILLGIGLSLGLGMFVDSYGTRGLISAPGSVPFPLAAAWVGSWVLVPAFSLIPFLVLYFPHGRIDSPRWRLVARVAAVLTTLAAITLAIRPGPLDSAHQLVDNPLGIASLGFTRQLVPALGITLVLFALSSIGSLIWRLRRAETLERQQLRWFVVGALLFPVLFAIGIFLPEGSFAQELAISLAFFLSLNGLAAAIGIAIFKHGLYEIDVVINKAVVFGALAAFVTAVYVGLVAGVGALLRSEDNLLLSVAATAFVAVAFQPVRERVQRFANRLVYGERATPYEVLSQLSEQVSEAVPGEDLLDRMARILAEGTGSARAGVWVRVGDSLRQAAAFPVSHADPVPLAGEPRVEGEDRTLVVRHGGELLGALTFTKKPGEALTPNEERLAADLASQAGLVLRNVRLTEELRAHLEELEASRQRLVKAQDEERRRLERNLHDGAQQQIVALKIKLGLAARVTQEETVKEMLVQLQEETGEALENLRDLARGIYPPLLASEGLEAALLGQARKAPVPVEVRAEQIGRYPPEVEAAVYFCTLEALQNVGKYARASRAEVSLWTDDGALVFTVRDDGAGFDPATTRPGSGTQNMRDRLAALGGELEVRSAAGAGTTITGRVPVGTE